MKIRHAEIQDLERMMEIYEGARVFMAEHGNPRQWGETKWPPKELIIQDIKKRNSYVCINETGEIVGCFFYIYGKDIEPTYRKISDGSWIDDSPYGVVHRIASDHSQKGIGSFCIT